MYHYSALVTCLAIAFYFFTTTRVAGARAKFEVKKPSESKKPWDYYKQLAVVPGDKAFPSAKDSGCPLTK